MVPAHWMGGAPLGAPKGDGGGVLWGIGCGAGMPYEMQVTSRGKEALWFGLGEVWLG
jgi:hypothetical protein